MQTLAHSPCTQMQQVLKETDIDAEDCRRLAATALHNVLSTLASIVATMHVWVLKYFIFGKSKFGFAQKDQGAMGYAIWMIIRAVVGFLLIVFGFIANYAGREDGPFPPRRSANFIVFRLFNSGVFFTDLLYAFSAIKPPKSPKWWIFLAGFKAFFCDIVLLAIGQGFGWVFRIENADSGSPLWNDKQSIPTILLLLQ